MIDAWTDWISDGPPLRFHEMEWRVKPVKTTVISLRYLFRGHKVYIEGGEDIAKQAENHFATKFTSLTTGKGERLTFTLIPED